MKRGIVTAVVFGLALMLTACESGGRRDGCCGGESKDACKDMTCMSEKVKCAGCQAEAGTMEMSMKCKCGAMTPVRTVCKSCAECKKVCCPKSFKCSKCSAEMTCESAPMYCPRCAAK